MQEELPTLFRRPKQADNVLEKEHENKLIVQSEKLIMPYLHIPLEDLSPKWNSKVLRERRGGRRSARGTLSAVWEIGANLVQ